MLSWAGRAAGQDDCPVDAVGTPRAEAEARSQFERALEREAADPERALELLLCAQRLADKPSVALRIGTIAERLDDLELAVQSYRRYLRLAGDAAPDRAELEARIEKLEARIEADRSKAETETETEPQDPIVPPPSGEADQGSGSNVLGWALVGGGAVLVVGGSWLLLSAKDRSDTLQDVQPGTVYWSSAKQELDTAHTEQTWGLVGLSVGAVAAAAGVYFLLSEQDSTVSADAAIGPSGAAGSLRVRF